jgi:hypothetical protein
MPTETRAMLSRKLSFKPLVWTLIVFIFAFLIPVTVFYPARDLLLPVLPVLLIIYLLIAIYALIRAQYARVLSLVLPHIAIAGILFTLTFIKKTTGVNLIDLARLHLFSQGDCINSAASLGDGKVFGVCLAQHDNIFVTSNLIIYDSSDQIMLPPGQRSAEWNRIASRMTPLGEFEFKAHSMGDHFYDAEFFEPDGR